MTLDNKSKTIFGFLSIILLTTLIIKLTNVPGGMILSGLFLGIMMLIIILIGCLILAGILKLFFKNSSYLTILSILTTVSFIAFHYKLYSPTLKIIVPNGFKGEVNLVLSNVEENILTIDSNGIGYINEWTFEKTYTRPIVVQEDGKDLDKNLVGFNPSTFWGKSIGGENSIRSISFNIISEDKTAPETFESKDYRDFIDEKLILLQDPSKGVESYKIETTVETN